MKIRPLILALTASLLSGLSVPSFADDTELFTGPTTTSSYNANVLFILDNSGSMSWAVDGTRGVPLAQQRMTLLKTALKNALATATGVNVGLGRFTKLSSSTPVNVPIVFPVTPIDDTVAVGQGQTQSLYVDIDQSSDDALEEQGGVMNLDSPKLLVAEASLAVAKSVTITLNGKDYLVSFLGITGANKDMWNYHVEELNSGGSLKDFSLDLTNALTTGCSITAHDGPPLAYYGGDYKDDGTVTGELVPEFSTDNIGWRFDDTFTAGDFSFTITPGTDTGILQDAVDVHLTDSADYVNGTTQIIGPKCYSTTGGGGTGSGTGNYDPKIKYGGKEFNVLPNWTKNNDGSVTWNYSIDKNVGRWQLGIDSTCRSSSHVSEITADGERDTGGDIRGIRWCNETAKEFSFKMDKNYPIGYVDTWAQLIVPVTKPTVPQSTTINKKWDYGSEEKRGKFKITLDSVDVDPNNDKATWKYKVYKLSGSQKDLGRFTLFFNDACHSKIDQSSTTAKTWNDYLYWQRRAGKITGSSPWTFSFTQDKLYKSGKSNNNVGVGPEGKENYNDLKRSKIVVPIDCSTKDYCKESGIKKGSPKTIGPICYGDYVNVYRSNSKYKIWLDNVDYNSNNQSVWTYKVKKEYGESLGAWVLGIHSSCRGNSGHILNIDQGGVVQENNPKIYDRDDNTVRGIYWNNRNAWGSSSNNTYTFSFTLDGHFPVVKQKAWARRNKNEKLDEDGTILVPKCSTPIVLPGGGGGVPTPTIETKQIDIGLRFNNIGIPDGATIESVKIAFNPADKTSNQSAALAIYLENSLTPATFSDSSKINDSSRTKVSGNIGWTLDSWETAVPASVTTPELKTLVAGMTSTWKAGSSLAFKISGTETGTLFHKLTSYDGDPSLAPKLIIQYKAPINITTRQHLNDLIDIQKPGGWTPIVDSLYEGAVYFRGESVYHGKDRNSRSQNLVSHPDTYTGGTLSKALNCNLETNPFSSACASEKITGPAVYKSPIESKCQNNYLVLLTDGAATANESVSLLQALPDPSVPVTNGPADVMPSCTYTSGSKKCGVALAEYLHTVDQRKDLDGMNNIIVHTIGFALANPTFIQKIATQGGGKFYEASDSASLETAFKDILQKAMRDNATLSMPGVAINRFNRRYHSDKVYYAVFKPTSDKQWDGNLKKYRLGKVTGSDTIELLDATGQAATDDNGIKDADQKSPLTPSDRTAKSYWSTVPDGKKVTTGGAGEQLKLDLLDANTTRNVYTVCGGNTVPILDSACTISSARVDWFLGKDASGTGYRWAFADALHSSPQVVTYGSSNTDETKTKIFIGTNDGMLRMINAATGKEDWAFVPTAMINPSYDGKAHAYGLDMTPVILIKDPAKNGIQKSAGDFVKLYIGMRRGGRNLYALDVTDITTPKPVQEWVIEGGTNSTLGDFSKLGQTWSSPKPVYVNPKYCSSTATECPVLLFGGGYDTAQDTNGFGTTTNNIGNAIYMVKADTGKLVWWASNGGTSSAGNYLKLPKMNYPIPADLNVQDTTGNGWIDRIYVGDLGGQVWRIDLDQKDSAGNLIERGDRVANLSDGSNTTTADDRRFFNGLETYNIPFVGNLLTIVSGRITDPMSETGVSNRFYAILDKGWQPIDPTNLSLGYELNTVTESDLENKSDLTTNPNFSIEIDKKGWFIELPATGEKGTAIPVIASKNDRAIVAFTTFTPPGTSSSTCAFNEGTSELYVLDLLKGVPSFDTGLDTNGNDIFDETNAGDDIGDQSITLKAPGMSAGVQEIAVKDPNSTSDTPDQGLGSTNPEDVVKVKTQAAEPPHKTFWRQLDE